MEIRLNGVSLNINEKLFLNNLDMNIKEGKINAIIGKNNSGKTNLLELFSGLIKPNKGEVVVEGNALMVFENPEELLFNNTVKEELEYALKFHKYSKEEIEERVNEALFLVELDKNYLTRKLDTLSSGERRKLAIASVLVHDFDILILDNPTNGLDNRSKESLKKLLRILKNINKTIIITSHDTNFLLEISDYVFILNNKKIALEGDNLKIFTNVEELNKYKIKVPDVIDFSYYVLTKKGIKLGYRTDINDLIKDIYRHVK